jgi:hypothetical protein
MNVDATVGRPLPDYPPLTGLTSRAELEAHPGWQHLRGQGYAPDPAAIRSIRENAAGVDILLFVGTWCPDSRRHVPRFFKLMDQAGLPESQVTIYGVDRELDDGEGCAARWDVRHVPTIVFLRGGQELGRLVEAPAGTLEGDIARILTAE